MSQSYRHTPICGLACAASEKADKQRWHRRFRRRNRELVRQAGEPLPIRVASNPWDMAKDGKQRFDQTRLPRLMRK